MDISIKKPCHENWNEMTPNQQGAFCGKCVKTVIDFSNKSIDEIKVFFTGKENEKVCGRFEERQLSALSFDTFFNHFKRFEFTKRFAVIVYFTFGMWLFNISNTSAQSNSHLKGDVQVQQNMVDGKVITKLPTDTVKCVKPKQNHPKIMGKVAAPKIDTLHYKLGEVAAPVQDKKSPKQKK